MYYYEVLLHTCYAMSAWLPFILLFARPGGTVLWCRCDWAPQIRPHTGALHAYRNLSPVMVGRPWCSHTKDGMKAGCFSGQV